MCVCVCACVCVSVREKYVHPSIYKYINICSIHTSNYRCMLIHIDANMHACTHTCIYIGMELKRRPHLRKMCNDACVVIRVPAAGIALHVENAEIAKGAEILQR